MPPGRSTTATAAAITGHGTRPGQGLHPSSHTTSATHHPAPAPASPPTTTTIGAAQRRISITHSWGALRRQPGPPTRTSPGRPRDVLPRPSLPKPPPEPAPAPQGWQARPRIATQPPSRKCSHASTGRRREVARRPSRATPPRRRPHSWHTAAATSLQTPAGTAVSRPACPPHGGPPQGLPAPASRRAPRAPPTAIPRGPQAPLVAVPDPRPAAPAHSTVAPGSSGTCETPPLRRPAGHHLRADGPNAAARPELGPQIHRESTPRLERTREPAETHGGLLGWRRGDSATPPPASALCAPATSPPLLSLPFPSPISRREAMVLPTRLDPDQARGVPARPPRSDHGGGIRGSMATAVRARRRSLEKGGGRAAMAFPPQPGHWLHHELLAVVSDDGDSEP
nr:proline-rich receptor-like protein kinase PERK14 [Aegilops tauschii subsp. strangulata]